MAITDDIMMEAARLPLPDAAYELWRCRDFFIRAAEQASPQDLSDPAEAATYGRQFTAALASDRCAAPDSAVLARLRQAQPGFSEAELCAALRAAVAFDDDCLSCYTFAIPDEWDRAVHAVAEASRRHPVYGEATLQAARMHMATSMR